MVKVANMLKNKTKSMEEYFEGGDAYTAIKTEYVDFVRELEEQMTGASTRKIAAELEESQIGGARQGKTYLERATAERLSKRNTEAFADKMRAAANADEIVLATVGWSRDGVLKHERTDNFVDFTRGTVLMKSGENEYTAETVVGITDEGKYVLYDVVKMEPAKFKLKEMELSTAASSQKTVSNVQEISEDSVPYDSENVKPRYRSCQNVSR